jgi:hypothetical protein
MGMAKIKLSVVIRDSHLPKFSEVVKNLKKAGMTVENQLKTTGIVTGSVDEKNLKDLKSVSGVAEVEKEHTYQIAPPESDVQ